MIFPIFSSGDGALAHFIKFQAVLHETMNDVYEVHEKVTERCKYDDFSFTKVLPSSFHSDLEHTNYCQNLKFSNRSPAKCVRAHGGTGWPLRYHGALTSFSYRLLLWHTTCKGCSFLPYRCCRFLLVSSYKQLNVLTKQRRILTKKLRKWLKIVFRLPPTAWSTWRTLLSMCESTDCC